MFIRYGIVNNTIDVTSICYTNLKYGNIIIIPSVDAFRAATFTDPHPYVVKSIFITDNLGTTTEFDGSYVIYIDTVTGAVMTNSVPRQHLLLNLDRGITYIHSKLKIKYGNLLHELPEQKLALKYLSGDEKILEIGGNFGRNSLVIAYMMQQKGNTDLVVLESDPEIFAKLKENKELNTMQFHIENAALSKRKLVQSGWLTIPSDIPKEGFVPVNTITYDELKQKYPITFDTLVLDCEGAFYYILQDMPEVLDTIKLIIMENDYDDITHKTYVDSVLQANKFELEYSGTETGTWGPCRDFFYQVWRKVS